MGEWPPFTAQVPGSAAGHDLSSGRDIPSAAAEMLSACEERRKTYELFGKLKKRVQLYPYPQRLRAHSCVTERYLTRKTLDKVNYEAVPGNAMLKYRGAFARNDTEHFSKFVKDVAAGEKKIHTETLFPYEIMRPLFNGDDCWWGKQFQPQNASGRDVLELLWKNQMGEVGQNNSLCVVDVSGSMFCGREGNPQPILIAVALGLYCAERCTGVFHNHMITFESQPHLVEIHGQTMEEKLRYMLHQPWGMSTNMEAVFDLLLDTAVKSGASQEEMPSAIYIISDMEFNCAIRDPQKTVYDNARELYALFGYELPAVIFQNVNSWQMQAPVRANTRGAALVSGAGTTAFRQKFDGSITPMKHMERVLMGERYKEVHA